MSKFHEKVEGRTKQFVGQIIGDDQLVREGETQERKAGDDRSRRGDQSAPQQEMAHSDQGIRRPASNRRTRNARNLSIKPTLITRFQGKRPVPTPQTMALRNYPPTGDSSQVSYPIGRVR
jgi:hypothetical protein